MFLLDEGAKDWWTLHAAKTSKEDTITWDDFVTVLEYDKRFTELAKYALDFVTNEVDKCKRFKKGLQTKFSTTRNWGYPDA